MWEWLADIVDIAESIDDVRGGPRVISTRCGGAVVAMGGRMSADDTPPGFAIERGAETLLKEPFGGLVELSTL